MVQFFPDGLTQTTFNALVECSEKAAHQRPRDLLLGARAYVEDIHREAAANPMVDVAVAEAILAAVETAVSEWGAVPEFARSWCKGMIVYFTSTDDEEDDLSSPIGFDDDAEVLNACLRLAGRDDLCVDPEGCGNA